VYLQKNAINLPLRVIASILFTVSKFPNGHENFLDNLTVYTEMEVPLAIKLREQAFDVLSYNQILCGYSRTKSFSNEFSFLLKH
jgi:hypothetical protein